MTLQKERLSVLESEIEQIPVRQVCERIESGAILIDIREPNEVANGSPVGALRIGRGFLESQLESEVPDSRTQVLVLCATGARSLFVADSLIRLGYASVASVKGGFRAWVEEGLPSEKPPVLGARERERYSRHLLIPQVGEKGQLRLAGARVAVIGIGGLGSPIALYLAAAGVGCLGLIDDDDVERSNLQRQILHSEDSIGKSKVDSAVEALSRLNPDIRTISHKFRLTADNATAVLGGYDLVIDGSDNLATRYLVNDACVSLGKPLIFGAIFQFNGEVSVFGARSRQGTGPCYRCLFPEPPPSALAPSCSQAGVLGVLPGIIGTLMAAEAIKLILGTGDGLSGRLLRYDLLEGRFSELRFRQDPDCVACGRHSHGAEMHAHAVQVEFQCGDLAVR